MDIIRIKNGIALIIINQQTDIELTILIGISFRVIQYVYILSILFVAIDKIFSISYILFPLLAFFFDLWYRQFIIQKITQIKGTLYVNEFINFQ